MTPLSVLATGARTPVGLAALPTAAAVRAGIMRIVEHPYLVDRAGDPYCVGMDPTITAVDRRDRIVALALSATTEALTFGPPAEDAWLEAGIRLRVLPRPPGSGPRFFARIHRLFAQTARQISARVGDLWCRAEGERVSIAGEATLYLTGEIRVPVG